MHNARYSQVLQIIFVYCSLVVHLFFVFYVLFELIIPLCQLYRCMKCELYGIMCGRISKRSLYLTTHYAHGAHVTTHHWTDVYFFQFPIYIYFLFFIYSVLFISFFNVSF